MQFLASGSQIAVALGALVTLSGFIFFLGGCGTVRLDLTPEASPNWSLTSTAFAAGAPIPKRYTCDGQGQSPPLQWTDPPPGTKSLALIADDPDAPGGTWIHWVLFNLGPATRSLSEGTRSAGATEGRNSFGKPGYGGPCPPSGTHRYFFRLYALDTTLDVAPGATAAQVKAKMNGHILGQTELMGTYRR